MMLLGKSTTTVIVAVVAILLAATAAPPKLRGTVRMAILLAQNGLPFHAIDTIMRLSALSKVDPSTCSASTRRSTATRRGTRTTGPTRAS